MTSKFTFKKEPKPTGLYSIGNPNPNTKIKHNKLEIGYISGPSWQSIDDKWRIRLMVDGQSEGTWKWVIIKTVFDSEPEARIWIETNSEKILALNLHYEDMDT